MLNYQQAKETIKNRESKKLENNTYLIRLENEDFAVKLHNTNVVTIHKDNTFTLDTGSWQTVTTKDRINNYSPVRIYQTKGMWYLDGNLFYDGIRIDLNGNILSEIIKPDESEKLKKKLDKLVSTYIKGFIQDIKDNGLNDPSNGDCFGCLFKDKNDPKKQPFGMDHYFQHFQEKYYVPSLLWNALQRRGNPAFCWQFGKSDPDIFADDLRHYFRQLKPELLEYMKNNETN